MKITRYVIRSKDTGKYLFNMHDRVYEFGELKDAVLFRGGWLPRVAFDHEIIQVVLKCKKFEKQFDCKSDKEQE